MARIRILEAVAGADFSWVPGDIVELSDEAAAGWADGHRAEWADGHRAEWANAAAPASSTVAPRELLQPRVVTADGVELDVIHAAIEMVPDPATAPDSPDLGRWSVTVAWPAAVVPEPADPADATGGSASEGAVTADAGDGDLQQVRAGGFDPITHSIREVLAYLAGVGEQEAIRVLDLEAASENPRKGIGREHDAILQQGRENDAARELAADGEQLAAEKTADLSRGGGRGDGLETR